MDTVKRYTCPNCHAVEHLDEAYCEIHVGGARVVKALRELNEAGRVLLPGPVGGPGTLSPAWERMRAALVDAQAALEIVKEIRL
jgi:hypothetical protein